QPDGRDRMKAAFSDSLKRAAVKFGVGRYLYRLPTQWQDYDPQRRQFSTPPTLPSWARPATQPQPTSKLAMTQAPPEPPRRPIGRSASPAMPATGEELQRRLYDYDARLASQGLCRAGDLVKHVVKAGVKAGYDADLATWTGPALILA